MKIRNKPEVNVKKDLVCQEQIQLQRDFDYSQRRDWI